MFYHGNMKKMSFLLALLFLLTSCNQRTYSFKVVAGFEVSNITQMQVSSSVYQSLAWIVDEKYYSYLDCSYVLVNFDIDEQFMGLPQSLTTVLMQCQDCFYLYEIVINYL